MKFSGPDLIVKSFEVDAVIVSKNVFSQEVLEQAAERLLAAWPSLSFRMKITRDEADDQPATSIHDGFFDIENIDRDILPTLTDCKKVGDIEIYNARDLHDIFRKGAKTWTDCFRPRIIVIHAAIMRDATVLKFTMQHIAGDAYAIHNAAAAFCEGLHGDIEPRRSRADVDYTVVDAVSDEKTKQTTSWSGDNMVTAQARAYWDWCTGSLLFPLGTIWRKYMDFRRNPAQWQTVYFPQHILDGWRRAAEDEGVKVSTYDLFASWLHMHVDAFSRSKDPTQVGKLAFLVRVKDFFNDSRQGREEFWNPFTVGITSDFPQNEDSPERRMVQGATNVRKAINEVRDPAYKEDYANMMKHTPARQGQPIGFGDAVPQTLILTSWTHAPIHSLPMWSEEHHEREPLHVQPVFRLFRPLPVPDEHDRQLGICWRGKDGGYWLTATFEEELWRRVLDVSSSE